MNMTTLIEVTPYAASALGVAMMARALHLYSESRPQTAEANRRKLVLVLFAALALPTLAHAQAVELNATNAMWHRRLTREFVCFLRNQNTSAKRRACVAIRNAKIIRPPARHGKR